MYVNLYNQSGNIKTVVLKEKNINNNLWLLYTVVLTKITQEYTKLVFKQQWKWYNDIIARFCEANQFLKYSSSELAQALAQHKNVVQVG